MISFLSQPPQQKITNPIKLHGRHKTQRQKIPWNPNFLQFHCLHHYCTCKSKISAFHGLLASSRWKMPAASAASPPAARASSKCSGLPAPLEAMTGRVQADFTYEGSQWGVQWQRFREVSRLRLWRIQELNPRRIRCPSLVQFFEAKTTIHVVRTGKVVFSFLGWLVAWVGLVQGDLRKWVSGLGELK